MSNQKPDKIRMIVLTAVMIAIMLVLQVTGIGLIDLGVIRVTVYCTVIAIGTLVLGWESGMVLGAAFTAISFWAAIQRPSAMVAPLGTLAGNYLNRALIGEAGSKHISTNFCISGFPLPILGWCLYSLPSGSSQRPRM